MKIGRAPGAIAREEGQIIVLVALLALTLAFAVGLATDGGALFSARRAAQEAADVGAWGGAIVLYSGGTATEAKSAALADAALNGYTTGGTTTITVNVPPASGPFAGPLAGDPPLYAEVIIDFQVRTALIPGYWQLSVRSVAGAAPGASGYAVMALDQGNTPQALYVQPPGVLNVNGGGIVVNSSSTAAAQNNGTVTVTPASSQYVDVHGGVSGTWPPSQTRTGQPAVSDPFASYPKPDTTGLTNWGAPVCCTLNPGVYTGSVVASSGAWTLNPGVYIFKGGGFTLTGTAKLSGSGVFLFLTNSTYPSPGGTCGAFNITSTAGQTLSPMTSGTYKNMQLFQDAACSSQLIVTGGGAMNASGTFYLPSAVCEMDTPFLANQLICKKIVVEGNTTTITYSSGSTAQPPVPALVE